MSFIDNQVSDISSQSPTSVSDADTSSCVLNVLSSCQSGIELRYDVRPDRDMNDKIHCIMIAVRGPPRHLNAPATRKKRKTIFFLPRDKNGRSAKPEVQETVLSLEGINNEAKNANTH